MSTVPDNNTTGAGERSEKRIWTLLDPRDALLALLLLAICAFLYYITTQFEEVSEVFSQNIPPEIFPRILLIIIAGLSLLLPFEHLLIPERWKKIRASRTSRIRATTWLTLIFILVMTVAAPFLGTVLTILLICLVMPFLWGERRLLLIVPFALIFTLVISLLFNIVLKVYFEPGIFNITP